MGQSQVPDQGWNQLLLHLKVKSSPPDHQGSQVSMRVARGERVLALESREGTRASRRVEGGLSRSFSGGGGKPSCPSPSAGDLRELARVPLRGEGSW